MYIYDTSMWNLICFITANYPFLTPPPLSSSSSILTSIAFESSERQNVFGSNECGQQGWSVYMFALTLYTPAPPPQMSFRNTHSSLSLTLSSFHFIIIKLNKFSYLIFFCALSFRFFPLIFFFWLWKCCTFFFLIFFIATK